MVPAMALSDERPDGGTHNRFYNWPGTAADVQRLNAARTPPT
jgi:hypothetical protein